MKADFSGFYARIFYRLSRTIFVPWKFKMGKKKMVKIPLGKKEENR